jgi:hypothetical protein
MDEPLASFFAFFADRFSFSVIAGSFLELDFCGVLPGIFGGPFTSRRGACWEVDQQPMRASLAKPESRRDRQDHRFSVEGAG